MLREREREIPPGNFDFFKPYVMLILSSFFNISAKLDDLLKDVDHQKWPEFPEFASYSGIHQFDDSLESYTLSAFDRRKVRSVYFDIPCRGCVVWLLNWVFGNLVEIKFSP